MPIKPILTITEWASDPVYTIGPKVGSTTKTSYAGIAGQGHVPGVDNPSAANEQNDYQNKMSLVAQWVMQGTSSKLLDPRVVEADMSGIINAAGLNVGATASAQAPSVFDRNTGTNAPTILSKSVDNTSFTGEAERSLAIVARARGQLADNPYWTAIVDGTWNDGLNPAGRAGGIRIFANNDQTIAPAPPAGDPLNARGLYVRNLAGTALECIGFASKVLNGTSLNYAAQIQNKGQRGAALKLNELNTVDPLPLSGDGLVSYGGRAYDVIGHINSTAGGHGVVAYGGDAFDAGTGIDPPNAGHGVIGRGGNGVPAGLSGGLAGAGIYGIGRYIDGPAGRFEHLDPAVINTDCVQSRCVDAPGSGMVCYQSEGGSIGHEHRVQGGVGFHAIAIQSPTAGTWGVPIRMDPQTSDPSAGVDGNVWIRRRALAGADAVNLAFFADGEKRYIPHFHNSPFRREVLPTGPWTSLDNGDEETIAAFDLDLRNLPALTPIAVVRYAIRAFATAGTLSINRTTAQDIFVMRLYDITAGGGPVDSKTHSVHDLTPVTTVGLKVDIVGQLLYTLPAGGQRNFELRFLNNEPPAGTDHPSVTIETCQIEMYSWNS